MTFEFLAGNLALDFTNTVHSHGMDDPQDDLTGWSDLMAWGQQAGRLTESEVRALRRSPTAERELHQALSLREAIYLTFSMLAADGKVSPEALGRLEPYLQRALGRATLRQSGENYVLDWRAAKPVERMLSEIAYSALQLLTSGRLDRIRQCGGETCSWLFMDTSKNGMRRWCDMRACGHRAKVRRFRRKAG